MEPQPQATVERWSGRRTDKSRVVFTGSRIRAEECYDTLRREMRQGEVRLIQDGTVVKRTSAPCLRTRW